MQGFTLHEYIAESVAAIAKMRGKNLIDLSKGLGTSPSFVYQVHQYKKHYNVEHLFLLSIILNCEVSEFFPSDFSAFKRYFPLSNWTENEFKDYLKQLAYSISSKEF